MERHITHGQGVRKDYRARTRRMRKELTPAERLLWNALREHRLRGWHFRRQQAIGSYIVDFICLVAGVVVEVDGAVHQEQRDYDAYRDEYLSSYNLIVLRFTNDQVINDLPGVQATIAETCARRVNTSALPASSTPTHP